MNILSQPQATKFFGSLMLFLAAVLFSLNSYADEKANTTKVVAKGDPRLVQIKARTDNDFLLFADYYLGGKRSGGVIVLHDCNSDRRAYRTVAKSLAQQDLHTLLVDLRGYGDSLSEAYSHEEAQKKSSDIVSYQSEMALITANWADDLLAMYQFLANKIDKSKGISVVTSGCSGAYVIGLAEKIQLNSMVMITPQMTYSEKERYKNLVDIPSYFVTSSHHQNSYETAQELFSWNGSKQSKMQIFKGDRYDSKLISRQKHLANDIALWVKFSLR
ncbi:MAG: hypothetical protein COB83_07480 [Gammaproteobacteria bacterium]|nr:MAG: hypothetical protein COB83_07480 [Gammaproteobacteria bacterium]